MNLRSNTPFAVLAVLGLAVAGVVAYQASKSDDADPAGVGAPAGSTEISDLYGGWIIDSVSIAGQGVIEPAPEHGTPRISFTNGGVTWQVCNTFSTTAEIGPDTVEVAEEGTMSLIGCPEEDRRALRAVGTVFRHAEVTWSVADGRLRIEGSEDVLLASRTSREDDF